MLVQGIDILHKLFDRTTSRTIIPLAAISNASNLAREPYCAALGDVILLASQYACSKQINSFTLVTDARIQPLKIDAVFHSTAFDKISLRNVVIIGRQTVGEAEIYLRFWVDLCGAEFNDVPQALGRPMHTRNRVGLVIDTGEGG